MSVEFVKNSSHTNISWISLDSYDTESYLKGNELRLVELLIYHMFQAIVNIIW